eukprot:6395030-Prymnesium_polylepis.1
MPNERCGVGVCASALIDPVADLSLQVRWVARIEGEGSKNGSQVRSLCERAKVEIRTSAQGRERQHFAARHSEAHVDACQRSTREETLCNRPTGLLE